MQGTVIRRATRSDVDALGQLGAELLRTHYRFDRLRFMAPGDDAEEGYGWFLGTQLQDSDALVLVAEREQDRAIVGYVYAGIEPTSWKELRDAAGFIHDVLVRDDVRGGGIGEALIEAAVAWLRERGMPRVLLWSAAANPDAQRLFERLQFRRTMVEMTREL